MNPYREYGGLNLGCGNRTLQFTPSGRRMLNVDMIQHPSIDLVMDLEEVPWPFDNGQFDTVYILDCLEHLHDILPVMAEIDRVLAPGGQLHMSGPCIGSYNHGTDITHRRGFTSDSFNFLLADSRNYLFRFEEQRPFRYQLALYWRENMNDRGELYHERFNELPAHGAHPDWNLRVLAQEIPGTMGWIFQKL